MHSELWLASGNAKKLMLHLFYGFEDQIVTLCKGEGDREWDTDRKMDFQQGYSSDSKFYFAIIILP